MVASDNGGGDDDGGSDGSGSDSDSHHEKESPIDDREIEKDEEWLPASPSKSLKGKKKAALKKNIEGMATRQLVTSHEEARALGLPMHPFSDGQFETYWCNGVEYSSFDISPLLLK